MFKNISDIEGISWQGYSHGSYIKQMYFFFPDYIQKKNWYTGECGKWVGILGQSRLKHLDLKLNFQLNINETFWL